MPDLPLEQWVKPEVLAQAAYQVKTVDHRIKLNQNESPWDWSEELKQEVLGRLAKADWNRYPDLVPAQLKEKLATAHGVSSDQVVVGKGSNEILQSLAHITLRPGDSLCTVTPTFAVYRLLGEQCSARVDESVLSTAFQVNATDLLSKSNAARLTMLCSPNSPTGNLVDGDLIARVLTGAGGVVVIDEAYADFSQVTSLPLLKEHPNLVITRTFSKAFALAGFRLGYGMMHPDLAREVQKGLLPFNIDLPSATAAGVLLDHADWVEEHARTIIQERDGLIARLNELPGVKAWPSRANFFLLGTPLGAGETFAGLARGGILVRDVSAYRRCAELVRVTVGRPEENEALFQAVRQLL